MKINFLDFELNIKKKVNNIQFEDINYLNNETINFVKSLPEAKYIEKLNDLKCDINKNFSLDEAKKKISNDGIFIVENFLRKEEANFLCKTIDSQINEYLNQIDNKNFFFEDNNILIQKKQKKLKTYNDLASYHKTVFDLRDGQDSGMIDIFNIDKLFKKKLSNNLLDQIRSNEFLNIFLQSFSKKLSIKNINSYANCGIQSTRGFHVDTFEKKIKIFIYLTDVLYLDDGPYTYVKGSHIDGPYRKLNNFISEKLSNSTETPIVSVKNIYPILAPKGTLVISDQAGFHRGFPQSGNGYRRVLVLNCI